ncbi:MAG: ATP-grasp domain-containing protein [Spirochaetes bacterium]|jgi:phosphoribosylamine-glycine ligase|nr:ATP-grasp domain-containing protein [Spirochaetota bacterium]
MDKRILVLGTNHGQADLIKYLKSDDWYVVAASDNSNQISAKLCDKHVMVDIKNVKALSQVVKDYNLSYVYSISSDMAIKSVVDVCEKMNLPTFYDKKFIQLLDDKCDLRSFLNDNNLSTVSYIRVQHESELHEWNTYPCIVKPVDSQGQRGVAKVTDSESLKSAVNAAINISPSGKAIVEEFLDGVEISCNVMVYQSKIVIAALSERLVHSNIGFGIPRGHLIPIRNINESNINAADILVRSIIDKLKIISGPLYFQMIVTNDGPKVVEIAPRLDGCHMWRLIKQTYGVDLVKIAINGLIGELNINEEIKRKNKGFYELMFQQAKPDNEFQKKNFPCPDDAIYHEYRYESGDIIQPVNGLWEVVGYYVRESL